MLLALTLISIDGKADQVENEVDNTGENSKYIKKLYPIFDISSMFYCLK